jgi:parallel beta-helix repeat protein
MKKTILLVLLLGLACLIPLAKSDGAVSSITLPCDIDGMRTINEAINTVAEGGKILVINGTWCQYVRICKPVSLLSLNSSRYGVVIDGKYNNYPDDPYLIRVRADNVTISGFTLLNSLWHTSIGIHAKNCKNLVIANCTIEETVDIGIYLVNVTNAVIFHNRAEAYCEPLLLYECKNITIIYNTFYGSQNLNIYHSRSLVFHHNNVLFKPTSAPWSHIYNTTCTWDDGHGHGNYWSNYKTWCPNATALTDLGIWDTPYPIDGLQEHFDHYPLIKDPQLPIPKQKFPVNRRIRML